MLQCLIIGHLALTTKEIDIGLEDEKKLDELWDKCESPIEYRLLETLYSRLDEDAQKDLVAQLIVNEPLIRTRLDFAFQELKIAIYCDGYKYHKDHESFVRDRSNARVLQFCEWLVLRFAGSEINYSIEKVVLEILLAIYMRRKERGVECDPPVLRNNCLDYYERGVDYLEDEEYGEAILDFTQAIKLQPDYALAYFQRAVCYGQREDFGKALDDLVQAIKVNTGKGRSNLVRQAKNTN